MTFTQINKTFDGINSALISAYGSADTNKAVFLRKEDTTQFLIKGVQSIREVLSVILYENNTREEYALKLTDSVYLVTQ